MSVDGMIIYCTCGNLRHKKDDCVVCAILGPEMTPTKEVTMTTNLKTRSVEIVRKEAAKEVR
jgi:hypothetical protein